MKDAAPAANGRFGISRSLHQQLFAYLLLIYGLALHELLHLLQILVGIECQAVALAAVAASSAGFLIISFKALGHVVMYDITNIRLVDAHTECDSGHYDIDFFQQECVLVV